MLPLPRLERVYVLTACCLSLIVCVIHDASPPRYREDTSGSVLRLLGQSYQPVVVSIPNISPHSTSSSARLTRQCSTNPPSRHVLIVHIDDCVIVASSVMAVDTLKARLQAHSSYGLQQAVVDARHQRQA
jgi:hypothetical protein